MPTLTELVNDEVATTFVFNDLKVRVTYRPSAMTIADLEVLMSESTVSRMAELMAKTIVSWDVLDDSQPDNPMLPITVDNIKTLPVNFVVTMSNHLSQEMSQGKAERTLAGGSPLEVNSVLAPSGTSSFE